MITRWIARLAVVGVVCGAAAALVPPGDAQAHPLGNLTVNHADALTLFPDRVERMVLDAAVDPELWTQDPLQATVDQAVSAAVSSV